MARAVLFDIDGTLIRTGGAGVKAFARAGETAFGIVNGTAHMKFAGRTDTGLVREFLTLHRLEPSLENIRRFLDAYVFWLDQMLPQCSGGVCPGVWKFIADLRALPEPPVIGLLTGNIRLGAEIKLRHYGLWQEFATGAFADDHEDRDQIAVAAHRRVGEKLKRELRGEEIIVVGDTPHDIRCGRAIGARVIAVATGGSEFEEIKKHSPDWCVKDLREVMAREVCR
ncbi:MAG: haloacid dehalogenase-like hydrolase [Verrucomicrobia bacterium]|nr:haloacid dehalogenase-like hydrolase [Verrucomicrobiota bacterium]